MDSGERRALRLAGRADGPQVRVEAVFEAGDGLHGLRPHVDAGVLGVVALPSCAAPGEDELPLPLALGALVANVVGVVVPAWPFRTSGCPPPACHIRGLYLFIVRILR